MCGPLLPMFTKTKMPTHVEINATQYELVRNSVILLEQIRTIDKRRLKEKICHLEDDFMRLVDKALKQSLALDT